MEPWMREMALSKAGPRASLYPVTLPLISPEMVVGILWSESQLCLCLWTLGETSPGAAVCSDPVAGARVEVT